MIHRVFTVIPLFCFRTLDTTPQSLSRRHTHQKLVKETCSKNVTQLHHSFLHQNNTPANHVARFVSQFLWWNKAVFYSVQETGTRLTDTRASFLYQTTVSQTSDHLERARQRKGTRVYKRGVCRDLQVRWTKAGANTGRATTRLFITSAAGRHFDSSGRWCSDC